MIFISGNSSDSYKRVDLGGLAHITIFNDSIGNALNFSNDGSSIIGTLYNEGIEFRDINLDSIYIKSAVVGAPCAFRLWSYGERRTIYKNTQQDSFNQNSPPVPHDLNYKGGLPTYGGK